MYPFLAVFAEALKHLWLKFTNTRNPMTVYLLFVLYFGTGFCSLQVLSHIPLIAIPPTKCYV